MNGHRVMCCDQGGTDSPATTLRRQFFDTLFFSFRQLFAYDGNSCEGQKIKNYKKESRDIIAACMRGKLKVCVYLRWTNCVRHFEIRSHGISCALFLRIHTVVMFFLFFFGRIDKIHFSNLSINHRTAVHGILSPLSVPSVSMRETAKWK